MKARVFVTLKPSVFDPQGHTIVEALHSLGYAQELKRGMGTFSNFAISFSIISILAGGFTSFWIGATFGGPLVITVGWVVVTRVVRSRVGRRMGQAPHHRAPGAVQGCRSRHVP